LGNPAVRRQPVDGRLRLYNRYPLDNGQGKLLLWLVENFDAADDHIVETLEFFEEYDGQGILQRKRLFEIHFRLSSKQEFEELSQDAGFRVLAFYGDYNYAEFRQETSPFMIWLLAHAA
jgi:hypothetical protein